MRGRDCAFLHTQNRPRSLCVCQVELWLHPRANGEVPGVGRERIESEADYAQVSDDDVVPTSGARICITLDLYHSGFILDLYHADIIAGRARLRRQTGRAEHALAPRVPDHARLSARIFLYHYVSLHIFISYRYGQDYVAKPFATRPRTRDAAASSICRLFSKSVAVRTRDVCARDLARDQVSCRRRPNVERVQRLHRREPAQHKHDAFFDVPEAYSTTYTDDYARRAKVPEKDRPCSATAPRRKETASYLYVRCVRVGETGVEDDGACSRMTHVVLECVVELPHVRIGPEKRTRVPAERNLQIVWFAGTRASSRA